MRMSWQRARPGFLVGILGVIATSPATAQRSVSGNIIISPNDPAASISVASPFTYVGASSFVLYGVADVELHIFVEADGARVKRLLWIQFEGYRDDNMHTYDYSSDPTTEVDGRVFHLNRRFYPASGLGGRPGSDGDVVVGMLRDAGYEVGPELARIRLVTLLNDPARDELMFIYVEDLEDLGISLNDLEDDDAVWAKLADQLESRALASFEIRR